MQRSSSQSVCWRTCDVSRKCVCHGTRHRSSSQRSKRSCHRQPWRACTLRQAQQPLHRLHPLHPIPRKGREHLAAKADPCQSPRCKRDS